MNHGKFTPTERIYKSEFASYLHDRVPVRQRDTARHLPNITQLDFSHPRNQKLLGRILLNQVRAEI